MSCIRGRGNRDTEQALARLFHQNGITGWRRHLPIFGRPDFVFPNQRLAIFVDGCFWHRCPRHSSIPVNNRDFWRRKLEGNVQRDRLVTKTLKLEGWRVIRLWEHQLKPATRGRCLLRIRRLLPGG